MALFSRRGDKFCLNMFTKMYGATLCIRAAKEPTTLETGNSGIAQ